MESLTNRFQKRHLSRTALAVYLLISLPVVLVFLKSEYVRYINVQLITNWRATTIGITDVYVGDSITAGGRNWGSFFNALNLGANSYTVDQIEGQISTAARFPPQRIFILAGTNDVLGNSTFDPKSFEEDYASLLTQAVATKAHLFVTLIPYTANARYTQSIKHANSIILKLAEMHGISTIDLNPHIAPNGILALDYTIDGVHLNSAAYNIWRSLIEEAQQNPARYQPTSLHPS